MPVLNASRHLSSVCAPAVPRCPSFDVCAPPQHAPRLLDDRGGEVDVATAVDADGGPAGQPEQRGDLVRVEQLVGGERVGHLATVVDVRLQPVVRCRPTTTGGPRDDRNAEGIHRARRDRTEGLVSGRAEDSDARRDRLRAALRLTAIELCDYVTEPRCPHIDAGQGCALGLTWLSCEHAPGAPPLSSPPAVASQPVACRETHGRSARPLRACTRRR